MIDEELYEILKMFINNKSYCLNEILNKKEVIKAHKKCPTASVRRSVGYLLSNGYLRYCNKNIKANAVIPNNEKMQITVKGRVATNVYRKQDEITCFNKFIQFCSVWVSLTALMASVSALAVSCSK